MKNIARSLVLGCLAIAFSATAQQPFAEGQDYQRLQSSLTTDTGSKIEVVEFFNYACPHCDELEPFLGPWIKTAPADVSFKRVPVFFHQGWDKTGKIYFTLEVLGRADLSDKVFRAIHVARQKMDDEKVFFDWAGSNGLDVVKVKEAWGSFTVNSKMTRAKTQAITYKADGVPMFFIDGKFRLQSTTKGEPGAVAHKNVPVALDFLIAKARAERKK